MHNASEGLQYCVPVRTGKEVQKFKRRDRAVYVRQALFGAVIQSIDVEFLSWLSLGGGHKRGA